MTENTASSDHVSHCMSRKPFGVWGFEPDPEWGLISPSTPPPIEGEGEGRGRKGRGVEREGKGEGKGRTSENATTSAHLSPYMSRKTPPHPLLFKGRGRRGKGKYALDTVHSAKALPQVP